MKALVLSDPHGVIWKVDHLVKETKPDLIIIPGDIPSTLDYPILLLALMRRGKRGDYAKLAYDRFVDRMSYRQIRTGKRILDKLIDYDIPVLLIHGNTETQETRNWLELYTFRHKNLYWIANDVIQYGKTVFAGFGWVEHEEGRYPSPGELSSEDYQKKLEELLELIDEKYPNSKERILISHAPPHGHVDYLAHTKTHAGSKILRKYLDEGKFTGVIAGHLHEAPGLVFHDDPEYFVLNAGSVIEDRACMFDLKTKELTWYHNVARMGLASFIYRYRNDYNHR